MTDILNLERGGRYNWKNQPERLIYLGKVQDHRFCPGWYQFAKVEEPNTVWCEVRSEDVVNHFEVTIDHSDLDAVPSDNPNDPTY